MGFFSMKLQNLHFPSYLERTTTPVTSLHELMPARLKTAWRGGEPEWAYRAVTPAGVTGQVRDCQELTTGKMGQKTPKRRGFIDD